MKMEYLICLMLVIAAAFGFAELFSLLQRKLVYQNKRPITISILPVTGHVENAELIVRDLMTSLRWQSKTPMATVILMDCGMDSETRQICDCLCGEYDCLMLCKEEELHQNIETLLSRKQH